MGIRKPSEERWFPRYYSVTSDFQGQLFDKDGHELQARFLDVSRDGLGILLNRFVKTGELVDLLISDRRVAFSVVYCLNDLIHQGSFRCGLHRRAGTSDNLIALFAANGGIEK